jgi:uncharacterized protein (TIGR02246 family)
MVFRKGKWLSVLVCALLLSPAMADPASEIEAAQASFREAFNAQDAAGIAAHFTEDAIALSPGWKIVEGREGIEKMYTAFLNAGFHGLERTPVTIDIIDDSLAIEFYLDAVQRTDKEGVTTEHFFKVLDVWRREDDGTWRIYRTSFNPRPGDQ